MGPGKEILRREASRSRFLHRIVRRLIKGWTLSACVRHLVDCIGGFRGLNVSLSLSRDFREMQRRGRYLEDRTGVKKNYECVHDQKKLCRDECSTSCK